jgi:hypothetical protein
VTLADEEMIERLRNAYDAFNRAEFDAMLTLAHPDIVMVRAGGQGELRGPDAIRSWLEPDAFESQVLEPVSHEVEGSRVLVHVRGTMRGAGSGIEMEIGAWTVWSFGDDGRVTRVENFLEHEEDEARRALRAP